MRRLGVLLVNVGTPDSPSIKDIRKFLREFLSDKRIVDANRVIWWLILNGIILPFRPKKTSELYKSIWTKDGSPLLVYGKSIARKLTKILKNRVDLDVHVTIGMTYGKPSVSQALNELNLDSNDQLIVLPLFPQYASATTAAAFDAVTKYYNTRRVIPELKFINGYWNHSLYIEVITNSIKDYWTLNGVPTKLLFSYHGLPCRYVEEGESYALQCRETTKLIVKSLETKVDSTIGYQSRFGKEAWLTPYTSEELKRYGKNGIDLVHVVCPGFSIDCLETIHEIAIEGAKIFKENGGKHFNYIPALNDSDSHVNLLAAVAIG